MLGSNFKVSEDLTKIIKLKITEMVLLSTQNICFDLEIRKLGQIIFFSVFQVTGLKILG